MKPLIADLHMHTVMSGHAFGTIREMAAEAAARGLKLIGTTEHGPGIPGTCDPIYFLNVCDAPRNLYGVELLYGSEVNILDSGRLDLKPRHIDCLDYVVAGIHGLCYTNQGKVRNTDNVIRAMASHPKVRFISHPDSDTYPMDYKALVEGAKEYGVALEVNNSSIRKPVLRPNCMENYATMVPLCMEYGVPIVINTDSHDPSTVGDFTLALNMLEKLGINEDLILNNDLDKLKKFLFRE